MILVLNLVFTFGVSGISIGGHIGGLIGGWLCGLDPVRAHAPDADASGDADRRCARPSAWRCFVASLVRG